MHHVFSFTSRGRWLGALTLGTPSTRMHYGKKASTVILWTIFCWETLGPAIHAGVMLSCTTFIITIIVLLFCTLYIIYISFAERICNEHVCSNYTLETTVNICFKALESCLYGKILSNNFFITFVLFCLLHTHILCSLYLQNIKLCFQNPG